MSPVKFIRKIVFDMTQQEFAAEIGVSQSRVSEWESSGRFPTEHQDLVRLKGKAVCATRGLDWNDSWFFEVPEDLPVPVPQSTMAQGGPQTHA